MAIEIAPPEPIDPIGHRQRRDMRSLWRVSAWGCGAAIALAALAITTQTDVGGERLKLAFGVGAPPSTSAELADLKRHALEKDAEAKRLEIQLLALATDRDRLAARLASLERNLDDMTGSIKKQAAAAAEAAVAKAAPPPPPANAPSTTVVRTESYTQPPPAAAQAQADVPAAEPVPLPPVRVAAAPTSEAAPEPPKKPEYAIDLGGAATMDVLNARWTAVKANYGPLLAGLRPLAAHDRKPGSTDLRLLVGPIPTFTAANQLCVRFAAARVTCRTTKFDGETLAQR